MMTRLSTVAVVTAAATLAKQASPASGYDMPATPTPSPAEDPTGSGGGDEAYEHLGCFHDSKADRVLGDKVTSGDMTTMFCFDYCTDLGAAFMATQWAFECWCSPDGGLEYNRHYNITGEGAVCDMPCMGDESEICGGFDSFELYKLMPASSEEECSSAAEPYEQCGGLDWEGSTCCREGYECVDVSGEGCYEQCRPVSVEETTPSPSTAATGMDTSMEAPTPAPFAMDRKTAAPVTTEPIIPFTPEAPPTPSPVAPETQSPVPAPTAPPVTPETPMPVPAPTAPPVTPETPMPVPAPTPSPVAPETPMPVPAPTAPPLTPETPMPVPAPTPSPVAPETPTPGTGAPADMQDLLDLHNEARCIHNADPLAWSSDVEASAAEHAKVLSDACGDLFHSESEDRNGYGENIYYCGGYGGSCYSAESAMEGFYESEIQSDSVLGYGGHATQILWKSTETLGCATSDCASDGRTYLVCQYDPPGNVYGNYEEEVELPTNAGNC